MKKFKLPFGLADGPDAIRLRGLLSASLMHFLNDLHPTILPAFLPDITSRLGLSLGRAGFLSTAFGVINFLVQPAAGYLADRRDEPTFTRWAPMFTAGGAYFLSVAPNYALALLCVGIMGVGTAGFHPQSHALTGLVSKSSNLGAYLAVFSAAGSLGSALSPLYAVSLLGTIGRSNIPLMLIPLFLITFAARGSLPKKSALSGGEFPRSDGDFWKSTFHVVSATMPLVIISVIRDGTSQGMRVFLPMLFTMRGENLEMAGGALFAFTISMSLATLAGGKLGDMFGKTRVIVISLAASPAFLLPAIFTEGVLSVSLFVVSGGILAASNSLTLALAHEYLPENRGAASSIVMGVSWGIANILAGPIGMLGDAIGLKEALGFVSLSPLLVALYLGFRRYVLGRRL
ncbi:MAG: MFS transporter [Synergistaceae bacterium]|jgi:FSR family fosmidomycin resistance protein-like MFS transporter|nr:MFS transporter [Synergistaceae bacterium]